MALTPATLAPSSNMQNDSLPRVLVYTTDDDIADVLVDDYWAGATSRARAGDFIFCNCADGNTLVSVTTKTDSVSTVLSSLPA